MKMVKKVLLGMVALAAVLTLASCGKKDDPEGAIKGGANNVWTIDYANDGTDTYRAYKETSQKHAGVIAKIRFDASNDKVNDSSKMGLIFNLHDSVKNDKDKGVSFYIIGISPDGHYYASEYQYITDIRGKNFGVADADVNNAAALTAKRPYEKEIIEFKDANKFASMPTADSEGFQNFYVWYKADENGHYNFKIIPESASTANILSQYSDGALSGTYDRQVSGNMTDTSWTDTTKVPQNDVAVYAQIQPNSTLKGKWKIEKFFHEAEDIEE